MSHIVRTIIQNALKKCRPDVELEIDLSDTFLCNWIIVHTDLDYIEIIISNSLIEIIACGYEEDNRYKISLSDPNYIEKILDVVLNNLPRQ